MSNEHRAPEFDLWIPNNRNDAVIMDESSMTWVQVQGIGYVAVPIVGGDENESDKVRISKHMRRESNIRRYYEPLVGRGTSNDIENFCEERVDDVATETETQYVDSESISNAHQRTIQPRTSNRR